MKIENEAQAVSEARLLINENTDAAAFLARAHGLAQWVLDGYYKAARENARRGQRMHVIVICDRYHVMTAWAEALVLPPEMYLSTRRQIHAQDSGTNPNRWRGFTSACYAIVKMREYTAAERAIFGAMQVDFGPNEYAPGDRVLIRSWLGIKTPLHDDIAKQRSEHDDLIDELTGDPRMPRDR